jgi:hypothetical protein
MQSHELQVSVQYHTSCQPCPNSCINTAVHSARFICYTLREKLLHPEVTINPPTPRKKLYSGFAWLIIMGSGSEDWIYWHFCYHYNQLWQLTMNECPRLAYWTASVFSSTVTNKNHCSHIELPLNDVCLTNALWRICRYSNLLDWTNFHANRIYITMLNS